MTVGSAGIRSYNDVMKRDDITQRAKGLPALTVAGLPADSGARGDQRFYVIDAAGDDSRPRSPAERDFRFAPIRGKASGNGE